MKFVAVGNDGFRPVIWGMGETEREALDAAAEWLDDSAAEAFLFVHPCTPAIEARVDRGDVSWADPAKAQDA